MILNIFDTETTGLPKGRAPLSKQPQIIELGCIMFDTDAMAVVEVYNQLINPGVPLTEEITKITGITDEMLLGMPSFATAWMEARRLFIGRVDGIVAHNAGFDQQLLNYELMRLQVNQHDLPPFICSMSTYEHVFGKRPSLATLHEHFCGSKPAKAHRASDDCQSLLNALLAAKFFDQWKENTDEAAHIAAEGRRDRDDSPARRQAQEDRSTVPSDARGSSEDAHTAGRGVGSGGTGA